MCIEALPPIVFYQRTFSAIPSVLDSNCPLMEFSKKYQKDFMKALSIVVVALVVVENKWIYLNLPVFSHNAEDT